MYHVSVQGVDERMINVHYYYYIKNHFVFISPAFLILFYLQVFQRMKNWPTPTTLSSMRTLKTHHQRRKRLMM